MAQPQRGRGAAPPRLNQPAQVVPAPDVDPPFGDDQLGGESEPAGQIIYLIWPENTSGSRACCPHDVFIK